jgi:hypothetical protein
MSTVNTGLLEGGKGVSSRKGRTWKRNEWKTYDGSSPTPLPLFSTFQRRSKSQTTIIIRIETEPKEMESDETLLFFILNQSHHLSPSSFIIIIIIIINYQLS